MGVVLNKMGYRCLVEDPSSGLILFDGQLAGVKPVAVRCRH
jgi:hypothetical protein